MKTKRLFLLCLLASGLGLLSSCMTAVPPSPQVQADVGDGIPAASGAMMASPVSQHGSRAASQTHDFYGSR